MKFVFFFPSSSLLGRSLLRIVLIYCMYFSKVFEYINILLRYVTAKISRYFIKILLIII